ncbi:uncharacterized protein RSE6_06767 [Rhynchosporium secalis]|uniref:Uncharacterized protein n=1 Tax=Rhynchosporium secalis TaxID=38038 RepID=A0A1E1MBC5_RHYSE|nr:uncharacterized protein RSE6_06767 [Rhynchosporium secalis]
MRTTILTVLALTLACIGQASAGDSLNKRAVTVAPPACSMTCLGTLIPQHCSSLADTTCICTNPELAAVLLPCAVAACNVTDSLQLARYQAETCEIPNDMSRYWLQIHTYAVLLPLTTLFVALRIFARKRLNVGLGSDDWVLLVAYAFYITMTSTAWIIAVTGFGQHTFWLLTRQVQKALKFFYISELLYLSSITFTKLSLLLFFRRIFPDSRFRMATLLVGAFIVTSNIALFMALALQCMPVHGIWTNWMYKVPPVKCINVFAAVYAAAGMSITHDVIILVMPIPTLLGLNLGIKKKANLMVMFGVGSFVIVASVIRLPSLMKMGTSSDPSFDQAPVAFWTGLEVSVGIICACLPACRSLIGYYFPRLQMSLNNTSGNGRKTPGYDSPSSGTKEYFNKKRAARDSFLELDDHSKSSSQEELKSKKSQPKMHTNIDLSRKSSDHRTKDGDSDSILYIQQNSPEPIEENFVPADRKGFGHMVSVAVGRGGRTGSADGEKDRTARDIVMTKTLDLSTTSRL